MALPGYLNSTTMMTPYVQARMAADNIQAPEGAAPYSQPYLGGTPQKQQFLISNPNYNPDDPYSEEYIQDASATGTPTAFSNDAGTKGIMNPYGLTQNNAAMGYGGAPTAPPATPLPASAFTHSPETIASPSPNAGPTANTDQTNRPPDQRGFEGHYDPTNNMTGYATPNGQFMMDQYGNWFDQQGNPTQFDQGGSDPTANSNVFNNNNTFVGGTPNSNVFNNNNTFTGGTGKAAAGTFMVNGKLINADGQPVTPDGKVIGPAGGPGTYGTTPGVDPYQRGVTSSSIDPATGKMRYDPTNPYQFATEATAQGLAKQYGGSNYGLQLEGPGMGFSTPQQQIRLANSQSLNAGLVAQALGRKEYGSGAPGSYGQYVSGITGDTHNLGESFSSWANRQPGYRPNPKLMNTPDYQPTPQSAPPAQQMQQQYQQQQTYQTQQYPQQSYPQTQPYSQPYAQPQYQQSGGYGQQNGYGNYQYPQSYQGGSYGGYGSQSPYGPSQPQSYSGQSYQNNYGGGYGQGSFGQQSYQYPQNSYGGSRSSGSWGQGGGNMRQGSYGQQAPQQGGYTAGQSQSGYKPYGQGYASYGANPTSSKKGGYMQTGKMQF